MRRIILSISVSLALLSVSVPAAFAQPAEWYQGLLLNNVPGQEANATSTSTFGASSLDDVEGTEQLDAAVEEIGNQTNALDGNNATNGTTTTGNTSTDTGSVWDNGEDTGDMLDPAEFRRKELRISREKDLERLILKGVLFFQGFLGSILVMMMIYGGYLMLWSVGNEERFTKGRMVVMNSIIGFIIVILSFAIINTLLSSTSVFRTIFAIFGR